MKITIDHYTFEGPTKQALIDALAQELRRRIYNYAQPHIYHGPPGSGTFCLVFQEYSGGFAYQLHRNGGRAPGSINLVGNYASFSEAVVRGRRHLAQDCYVYLKEDGSSCLYEEDEEGKKQHAEWVAWQDRFHAAQARGLDDIAARKAADERKWS